MKEEDYKTELEYREQLLRGMLRFVVPYMSNKSKEAEEIIRRSKELVEKK